MAVSKKMDNKESAGRFVSWVLEEDVSPLIISTLNSLHLHAKRLFSVILLDRMQPLPGLNYKTVAVVTNSIDAIKRYNLEFFDDAISQYEVSAGIIGETSKEPLTWSTFSRDEDGKLIRNRPMPAGERLGDSLTAYTKEFWNSFAGLPEWRILTLEWISDSEVFEQTFFNVKCFLHNGLDAFIHHYFFEPINVVCYGIRPYEITAFCSKFEEYVKYWDNPDQAREMHMKWKT